jgi:hypothetical protein
MIAPLDSGVAYEAGPRGHEEAQGTGQVSQFLAKEFPPVPAAVIVIVEPE